MEVENNSVKSIIAPYEQQTIEVDVLERRYQVKRPSSIKTQKVKTYFQQECEDLRFASEPFLVVALARSWIFWSYNPGLFRLTLVRINNFWATLFPLSLSLSIGSWREKRDQSINQSINHVKLGGFF